MLSNTLEKLASGTKAPLPCGGANAAVKPLVGGAPQRGAGAAETGAGVGAAARNAERRESGGWGVG